MVLSSDWFYKCSMKK